jgi:hypothetical protein
MTADMRLEELVQACAAARRAASLARIDEPPGEARAVRLGEALRQAAESCAVERLQALDSYMAAADTATRDAARWLRAWCLETRLRAALLPSQQALQDRQRTATCVVDEESIPLLASFAAMAGEQRRDRRAAIEAAVAEQLESLESLFEAQYNTMQRVAGDLGYASLEALWTAILPVEPAAQEDYVTQLLRETHDVYADLLTWAASQRLNVPPGQLRRHDILTLFTWPEYQRYYQPGEVVSHLEACLHDMTIDPQADGRLVLRPCPPAFGVAAAVPVNIPDEIVVTYSRVEGVKGAEAYASAYGTALLWAHTSPELPLLRRVWSDAAVSTSSAQLFAEMIALPGWLRQYGGVRVDGNYWPWRRLDRLYRLRRQLGRFLYTRQVCTTDSLAGAREAYRDIMTDACLVEYPAAYYLVDWDWSYTSLSLWRGWGLAYGLLWAVRHLAADDWFRNPDSGAWLRDYWRAALAGTGEALFQECTGSPWEASWFAALLNDETWW